MENPYILIPKKSSKIQFSRTCTRITWAHHAWKV